MSAVENFGYVLEYVLDYVEINVLTVALGLVVFVLLFWSSILEKHKYPPGPIPLPFIGNGYSIFAKNKSQFRYKNWSRKYGNVVSYVMFGQWTVELFGYDAIHEAFVEQSDIFSNREAHILQKVVKAKGLIFSDDWKELRRQALTVFRDHGMGKLVMEAKIIEEQEYLIGKLSSLKGTQSSDTFKLVVGGAVSNVINQVVFGRRLDYEDVDLKCLRFFEAYYVAALKALLIPGYKYLPWDPIGLRPLQLYERQAREFFRSEVELHRKSLDINEPRDYIDTFLIEGIKNGNSLFSDEEELCSTISQLYIAGYDTTSTTLTWALLFLVNYPQCQDKIHEEICKTVGSRAVCWKDRVSMHYTQAFIQEVLRFSGLTGSALSHVCTADTVIQGHSIPKGCRIMANLYSTYHDESVFPESYLFKSERFLNSDGEFVKPTGKQMLPFSLGKRACLGEGLARTELFMFLVSIVQQFHFTAVGETKSAEEGIDVFTHSPLPFKYTFCARE